MQLFYVDKLTGNAAEDAMNLIELYHIPAYRVADIIKHMRPDEFTVCTDAGQPIIEATKYEYKISRWMIIPTAIKNVL